MVFGDARDDDNSCSTRVVYLHHQHQHHHPSSSPFRTSSATNAVCFTDHFSGPGQLSLLSSAGQETSAGRSAMMFCGWGVKAGWLIPFVVKRVGNTCHNIPERVRDGYCTHYKALYNNKCIVYFQLQQSFRSQSVYVCLSVCLTGQFLLN